MLKIISYSDTFRKPNVTAYCWFVASPWSYFGDPEVSSSLEVNFSLPSSQKVALSFYRFSYLEQQNPTQTTEAALVKNTSGKPVTFTMKGNARATAEATGGGTGNQKVSAVLVHGSADFTMQDDAKASAVANSGEEVDWTQMDLTVALKKRMLTVPSEILAKLAKELAEKFGVHHLSDLEFVDLKELENRLESVIGVELKRFLAFVTEIKELCRKKKETNDPPSSMYN